MLDDFKGKYPGLAKQIIEMSKRDGSKWTILPTEPARLCKHTGVLCSGASMRRLSDPAMKSKQSDWYSWICRMCLGK